MTRALSLAWLPLLVLWLKFGEESKITLIAIGAFFPVYTTVSLALRAPLRNVEALLKTHRASAPRCPRRTWEMLGLVALRGLRLRR